MSLYSSEVKTKLERAAERAVFLAETAAERGTFGVGGVLLGPDMEPLFESENRVIQDGHLADPTAHAERLIIDWYFHELLSKRPLPAPHACTIITSLDPCMQCAGAILATGFRCLSIGIDVTAGVHCYGRNRVDTLPRHLQTSAEQQMFQFCMKGSAAEGLPEIDLSLARRATRALEHTLADVRDRLAHADDKSNYFPVSSKADNLDNLIHVEIREANRRTMCELFERSSNDLHTDDISAFVDPEGKGLYLASERFNLSPIRTSVMELVKNYAKLRRQISLKGRRPPSHPRKCELWSLDGPGNDALSVMNVGAFGSTLEGPSIRSDDHWSYLRERQTQSELTRMLQNFPPLYNGVIKIAPRHRRSESNPISETRLS